MASSMKMLRDKNKTFATAFVIMSLMYDITLGWRNLSHSRIYSVIKATYP